jgi:hypothetical protein
MADKIKNIYLKLISSYKEKRLKKQKTLTQILLMSGSIKRVK